MPLFLWEATPSALVLSSNDSRPACASVFQLDNVSSQCHFVRTEPDCLDLVSHVNYLKWFFCAQADYRKEVEIAYLATLVAFFIALGVAADSFLCPNLATLSNTLKLSQNLAGVTFLALGNGAPDVFAAVAAVSQSRPHMMMGALFGAGLFITTVIAGSVVVAKPFKVMKRPFLRDAIFFLVAGYWAFCIFFRGQIRWYDPVGFLALYVVYLIVVVVGRLINRLLAQQRQRQQLLDASNDEDSSSNGSNAERDLNIFVPDNPVSNHEVVVEHEDEVEDMLQSESYENEASLNTITNVESEAVSQGRCPNRNEALLTLRRRLNPLSSDFMSLSVRDKVWELVMALFVLVLRLSVPVVDLEIEDTHGWCQLLHVCHCYTSPLFALWAFGGWGIHIPCLNLPLWTVVLVAGQLIAVLIMIFSTATTPPSAWHRLLAFIGFGAASTWIYLIANEIVSLLRTLGIIHSIPDAILGLSVLAWGNSVGDLVADVTLARRGFPRMGFSGCYGGPLFNLLLGIGLPYTIYFFTGDHGFAPVLISWDPIVFLLCGALAVSLITSMLLLLCNGFDAPRWFGIILILLYVAFMIVAILLQVF